MVGECNLVIVANLLLALNMLNAKKFWAVHSKVKLVKKTIDSILESRDCISYTNVS